MLLVVALRRSAVAEAALCEDRCGSSRREILALSVRSRVQLDWLVQNEGLAACKTLARFRFKAGEAFEHPSPAWNCVLRSAGPCLVSVIALALRARSRVATSVAAREYLQESTQPSVP